MLHVGFIKKVYGGRAIQYLIKLIPNHFLKFSVLTDYWQLFLRFCFVGLIYFFFFPSCLLILEPLHFFAFCQQPSFGMTKVPGAMHYLFIITLLYVFHYCLLNPDAIQYTSYFVSPSSQIIFTYP